MRDIIADIRSGGVRTFYALFWNFMERRCCYAKYSSNWISEFRWDKFSTKWGVQIAGMIFQIRSRLADTASDTLIDRLI